MAPQLAPLQAYLAGVAHTAPRGYVETEISPEAPMVAYGTVGNHLLLDILSARAEALATGDAQPAVARLAAWAGYIGSLLHSDAGLVTCNVSISLGRRLLAEACALRDEHPEANLEAFVVALRQWPSPRLTMKRGLQAE